MATTTKTVTSPDDVKLQKGALAATQKEQTGSQKATALIESLAAGKPSLPTGTTLNPQLQNIQSQELMATSGLTGQVTAATPTTAAAPTIAGPTAGLAGTQAGVVAPGAAQTMTAATVAGATPTVTAAQQTGLTQAAQAATGTITADATVKGQLGTLQKEVETALASGNPLPVWARGAAKATEAALANRGLSASSMAAEADDIPESV
jgi:hypothetical protein